MNQADIFKAIIKERKRQDGLWGEIRPDKDMHSHFEWLALLMQEIGEVAQAVTGKKFGFVSGRAIGGKLHVEAIRTELIHCAAVIFSWLEDRF